MAEPLVRATDVTKTYSSGDGSLVAVDNACFEVAPGASVALTGPSGSGKTTLLHMVAGIDTPSGGSIVWPALGARGDLRPRWIAMAFQGPSLLSTLNVLENLAFPLLLLGETEVEAESRARSMLCNLGLDTVGESLPEELSGGQAQRAGIGRALIARPALVVADEPTGQQDHEHAGRLMDFMLSFIEETGAALIVATHDPAVAGRLSTVWSMENGRLEQGGRLVRIAVD
jgi:ABC-type lipoprotein export system ATPase subunit